MDAVPKPRRGRSPKAVSVAQSTGTGREVPEEIPGLGEAGSGGAEVSAEPRRESEKLAWGELIRLVHEKHSRNHQIATVWHPESEGETLETKLGNVRVLQGPAQYQLTTGEMIEV